MRSEIMTGLVGAWQETRGVIAPELSDGMVLLQHMAYLEKIPTEKKR